MGCLASLFGEVKTRVTSNPCPINKYFVMVFLKSSFKLEHAQNSLALSCALDLFDG